MKKIFILLNVIAISLIFCGCSVPAYDVEVHISPKFKEQFKIYPSLEVDIAGVNENEAERFSAVSIDEYFQINNPLRQGSEHVTLCFSEGNTAPKQLAANDPVWKIFHKKEAVKLYLIANIPADNAIEKGKKDHRKQVVPLEKSNWFSSNKRYFEISPAGINILKNRPENKVKEAQ